MNSGGKISNPSSRVPVHKRSSQEPQKTSKMDNFVKIIKDSAVRYCCKAPDLR